MLIRLILKSIFYGVDINTIPLTVPAGTVADYQSAAVWQDFASIVLDVDDFTENTIDIQIYPNPVQEQLYIDLSSDIILEKVKIYTNLGKLIKQEVSSRIDVSNLTSGLYYVVITTNKGKTTKKLLVE